MDDPFLTPIELNSLRERWVELSQLKSSDLGRYPWDHWEARALDSGLAPELASLGRTVMSESLLNGWPEEDRNQCGWRDAGHEMLQFAKAEPLAAAAAWRALLRDRRRL